MDVRRNTVVVARHRSQEQPEFSPMPRGNPVVYPHTKTDRGGASGLRPMILIVDDHFDSCEVLKRLLAQRGLEARCAHSAHEAMEMLKEFTPTVAVLDDMMPEATGVDLLKEMRRNPETAGIRVIFFSAVFDYDRQREAKRLGAKDWMVKGTVRMSELVDRIA